MWADAVEVFMLYKDLFKLCYRCKYVFKVIGAFLIPSHTLHFSS